MSPVAAERGALDSVRTTLEMIKVEHTVFALPFAFLGMMMAARGWPAWSTVAWIVVAMVGARTAAMAFNRLVDRSIDARNPRTATRALPAGELGPATVRAFVVGGVALLVLAAWRLNPLALQLSPLAIGVILAYSYTKRFTALSHLVLGLGISAAPLGAWIAVRGTVEAAPVLLAVAVMTWIAGFDVLYALQDLDFDRSDGLHSIPARLGVRGALVVSGLLHALMAVCLVALPAVYDGPMGSGYAIGVVGCLALLVYQHWILRPGDLSRLDAAFFPANGALAIWLFASSAVGILLR